ncbi:MAG: chromosome segregation protein SMC [bacterium]
MFLRRLELYGFKSFAKRTKIEFGPGITAIVGPNGSGKSNIADAIRWVLGEQRVKSLRGQTMEDLIFAGSDQRSSLGYAEVVLVLDNSLGILPLDFTEVAVTRQIYRSGDSQFSINKVQCRLRDIQELFLDTGIGRDTYAIISQGQVEKVLTMRPEERRLLLEETAGVLKYRYRKEEVLRKLAEAEQNLLRLQDLLSELEQNLPILKKEAEQERLYREYRAQLENEQISLAIYQLDKWRWEQSTQVEKLQAKKRQEEELTTSVIETISLIQERKVALSLQEENLRQKQQSLSVTQAQAARLEEGINYRQERCRQLSQEQTKKQDNLQHIKLRSQELMAQAEKARNTMRLVQEQEKQSFQELAVQEGLLKELTQKFQVERQELELSKEQVLEALHKHTDAKNKWQLAQGRYQSMAANKLQLEQQISKLNNRMEKLEQRRKQVQAEKTQCLGTLAEYKHQMAIITEKQAKNQAQTERIKKQLKQNEQDLYQVKSRCQILQEMGQGYEGFHRGVRTILQGNLAGVCGPVAELLRVDKRFEIAVAVALGSSLQFLVVESDTVAQRAIEFLQQQKGGRATFLPLNAIGGQGLPKSVKALLKMPGVLGRAVELVQFDPIYQEIAEYLLGRVIVTEELSIARELARKLNFRYKLVTINGELIDPGGAITGGTLNQNQVALLSRKREEEELSQRQEVLTRSVEVLERKRVALAQQDTELQMEQKKLGERIKENEFQLVQLNKEEDDLERERQRAQEEKSVLEWERQETVKALLDAKVDLEAQEQEISYWEKEEQRLREYVRKKETGLQGRTAAEAQLREEVNALKIKLAGLSEQIKGQQYQVLELENRCQEQDANERKEVAELNRLKEEEEQVQSMLENERAVLARILETEAQLYNEVQELQAERVKLTDSLALLEQEVRDKEKELTIIRESLHQLERELTRLETAIAESERHLFEDYSITPAKADHYRRQEKSITSRQKDIAKYKSAISELGNVNLRASVQYQELEERYQFLHKQQEDVKEAKRSLRKLLQEIDSISRKRLEKTFKEVQYSFRKVFQELFGGGEAKLQFTQEEDLLDAGLEIIVQPPGKKLQNLLLLSGGEKALAAIAFLFGILQVKPSPFCILDEIDASLDAVNANRLGDFLQRYAQVTQFIVITHRQELIQRADTLYGVAMDSSGLSQLISLKIGDTMVG